MTAFTHTYGQYAAIGSFNTWFATNLAVSKPSWMTSVTVNFDYPRTPLVYPSFSVTHFSGSEMQVAAGGHVDTGYKGVKQIHVCEVSCWVTQNDNANWQRDIRQMTDMVTKLLRGNRSISILDLYASGAATGAILRVQEVRETEVAPDAANPNTKRARFIVTLEWIERWA